MNGHDALQIYSLTAEKSAAVVIRRYSTSFGRATAMLSEPYRTRVRTIYALVRIADEIVDGPAEAAGAESARRAELLDQLEVDTERALQCGYSANLVVHAFAQTAASCDIDTRLTAPFFSSMRRDLSPGPLTRSELSDYIYGSAEVVGLMCLRAFLVGTVHSQETTERLESGARSLGSAFQKINFLRDLGEDTRELGRGYFGTLDGVNAEKLAEILAEIRSELREAADAIPLLPRACRGAVTAAHALFSDLAARIGRTPPTRLIAERVRVPTPMKAWILTRTVLLRRGPSAARAQEGQPDRVSAAP